MRDTILVLTNSEDGDHTDSVIAGILKRGKKVFRFDSDKFSTGETKVIVRAENEISFALASPEGSIESKDIGCVWYRRPNHFIFDIQDQVQKRYAEAETKAFLEGLWRLTDAFWVNHPAALESARDKVLQFRLALGLGLKVPKTIITNDPTIAREFVGSRLNNSVFKAIRNEFLDYGDRGFNIPTTLLGEAHLAKMELVKKLPSLFQECVERQYEVRVTMVGGDIFPVRIKPKKDAPWNVDWRHPNLAGKVDYDVYDLPPTLVSACKEIKRRLDLRFCVLDFARDLKGDYIFFEVNPNGQWYWLEKETGLPISDAISNLLVSGIASSQ